MSKNLKKKVPELRFPEFEGNWETDRIDQFLVRYVDPVGVQLETEYKQIGIRSHGKGIFHKDSVTGKELGNKRVFWVHPRAFVVNIVFAWEQAVALTSSEEEGFIASHRFLMFLPKKNKANLEFILLFFLRRRGKNLLEIASPGGAGRNKTLGQQSFAELEITLPQEAEQEKIASFLGAIANRLTQLRRKQELLQTYKRGIMQKIFSQQIRFKSDDGKPFPDWEKKKLGEIATRQIKKNLDESITRVLTNSAVQGVVDQQDYFDKDIANANNLGGYYLIEKGDYVYNPRISANAPVGPIHKNNIGLGVMSPLYTIFSFKAEKDIFYEQYFKTSLWHKYICSVANYGARHDRMNISTSDFMALPLPYPIPEEQQKIVDFLTAIDKKIEAVAQRIELTEQYQKGLLQKMFV